jgi:undecaprenyl pyrophosphate phosphatase UppP
MEFLAPLINTARHSVFAWYRVIFGLIVLFYAW